jgi:hypothetical protein
MPVHEQMDFGVDDADNLYLEHDIATDNVGALNHSILSLPPSAFATPQGIQRNSAGTTITTHMSDSFTGIKMQFLPLLPSADTPSNLPLVNWL